jgi:hypothetical protein
MLLAIKALRAALEFLQTQQPKSILSTIFCCKAHLNCIQRKAHPAQLLICTQRELLFIENCTQVDKGKILDTNDT